MKIFLWQHIVHLSGNCGKRCIWPKFKEDIIADAWHVEDFQIYELMVGLNLEYEQLSHNPR